MLPLCTDSERRDNRDSFLPADFTASQSLATHLRAGGSDGIVYLSQRHAGSQCVGLFYPDLASNLVQGRHLDYNWNDARADFYREAGNGDGYRIDEGGQLRAIFWLAPVANITVIEAAALTWFPKVRQVALG